MKSFNVLILFSILAILAINFGSAFDWNTGLVSYYKLDDASSGVKDTKGIYNLTASGSPLYSQVGKIGTAIAFDSAGDYFASGACPGLDFGTTSDFTLNFWTAGGTSSIGVDTNYFATSTAQPWYRIYQWNADSLAYEIATGGGADRIYMESTKNVSDGNWHMITMKRNNSGTNNYLYIDGVLNISSLGTATKDASCSNFYIGETRLDRYMATRLDEFGIWNRSLTDSEITQLYNSGAGLPYGSNPSATVYLNLLSPLDGATLSTDGTNFTVGGTIDSSNLNWTNITYYIWNINGSLFNKTTTATVNSNITNTSLFIDYFVLGQNYLWNANGCYGNSTYSNCTWSNNGNFTYFNLPFNNASISYISSVLETDYQTYNLTIQANPSVSSVVGYFWYDGTRYSSTPISNGAGSYTFRNALDVPLQQSSGNKSFLWQFTFTLTDSSVINSNSTTYSQQVNRTILQICNGTYETKFVNFTTKSATNPFPIVNGTFKSAWNWYVSTGHGTVTRNYTYEELSNTLSNWNFCGSPNVSFITDAEIEYDGNGYALNFYYINGATLTNSTNNITLYLLNDSLATTTVLKVVDSSQQPLTDYTIQIQFYDVGTGTFYTIANAKTDYKGEDVVYLNWYDSLYKFIILDENLNVVKTTGTTKITSSPTYIEVTEEIDFAYDKFENFVYTLYYENSTSNFVLTYTKPSGEVDEACLRVFKRGANSNDLICNQCETSSSATVFCNIGSYGNGSFVAYFYATGSYKLVDWIVSYIGGTFQEEIYELLGNEDASFYAFLFAILVTVALFINAVFGIIALMIGLIGASALGFTAIQWGQMMGVVIVGGFIIWLIKR